MNTRVAIFLVLLGAFLSLRARGSSDLHGHNPQHDFGEVWHRKSKTVVPFWTLDGTAAAYEEYVRLTPDRQSQTGYMWNTEPNRFSNWELVYKIRIHGQGTLGADGMGFWYISTPKLNGDFFGLSELFIGLGVVIDTYDNDGMGHHPRLMVLYNDGTKQYEHVHDGHKEGSMELGSCHLPIRNVAQPSLIRVTYQTGTVKVETDIGGTGQWLQCVITQVVQLPNPYYFGFSATTGQLADNHDIYGASIKNLDPNARLLDSTKIYTSPEKYMLVDYLSRIQFEVVRGSSGTTNNVISNTGNIGGQLQTALATLQKIEATVNRMSPDGNSAVINLLNEVKSLVKNVPTPSFQQVPGEEEESLSILSALWYGLIMVLIGGGAYLAYTYFRVKQNKRPHLY